MPAGDVSDLRDVVDAINRLCDTMKTSQYGGDADEEEPEPEPEPEPEVSPRPLAAVFAACPARPSARAASPSPAEVSYSPSEVSEVTATPASTDDPAEGSYPSEVCDLAAEILECLAAATPEEAPIRPIEVQERWSDSTTSLPVETVASDTEPVAPCEPASEMYYTASSEVSLLSDTEAPERVVADDDSLEGRDKDDRKECVIAGHVAAMRERFESMTRTNTPCPDLMRSSSPSLDVFRNITPSPDRLG